MKFIMKKTLFFISIFIMAFSSVYGSSLNNSRYAKAKLTARLVKHNKAQRSLKSKKSNLKNGSPIKALSLNINAINKQNKAQKTLRSPMSAIHNRVLEDIRNKKIAGVHKYLPGNYIKKNSIR